MDETETYAALTDVFRDVFEDDDLHLNADMTADDVEDWDSLSHMRLILSVEKAFGIHFSTVEVGSLNTVGDLVRLIRSKQS
ncbi:hypothetical protein SPAN111604_08685 [Sphingomonas antarctica]|uniref:acyl carrier protein n=1 Tax=Sphingomonas antarctica TaxID=2040274 RepID=UPI0039EAA4DA